MGVTLPPAGTMLAWRVPGPRWGQGSFPRPFSFAWGPLSKNDLSGGATRWVRQGLPYPNYPHGWWSGCITDPCRSRTRFYSKHGAGRTDAANASAKATVTRGGATGNFSGPCAAPSPPRAPGMRAGVRPGGRMSWETARFCARPASTLRSPCGCGEGGLIPGGPL